jgi:hypothetical protein
MSTMVEASSDKPAAELVVVDLDKAGMTESAIEWLPVSKSVHYLVHYEESTKSSSSKDKSLFTCPHHHEHNAQQACREHKCNHVKNINYASPLAMPYHKGYTFDKRRRAVEAHKLFDHRFHHEHRAKTPKVPKGSAKPKSARPIEKPDPRPRVYDLMNEPIQDEKSCTIL